MARAVEAEAADRVLASERSLVLALGGFSIELSGASLVTHERIPVPSFNYAVVGGISRERQSVFFERTLDHYFQRALRPTIRVRTPVPPFLDAGLRRFGFVPFEHPIVLLEARRPALRTRSTTAFRVVRIGPLELDRIVPFWAGAFEHEELRRALATIAHHPNPSERLTPLAALRDGGVAAAALVYSDGATAGIHAVATEVDFRGAGAATALVRHALGREIPPTLDTIGMTARHPRISLRLQALGFRAVGELIEYELPAGTELHLPSPGPPVPPRWRPPRVPPSS
ncbi:MAG: GNAT family N-acetyltransferase [Thermoplasmata archaeon]|nr:GNAT family N-acetyltransferase [Thermoplasmata archaeon]